MVSFSVAYVRITLHVKKQNCAILHWQWRFDCGMDSLGCGSREPLHWHKQFLDDYSDAVLSRVDEDDADALQLVLSSQQWVWGSSCSGTDSCGWCFSAFARACHRRWELQVECMHAFSAEIVNYKRDFILRHHQPLQLFKDGMDLSRESAYCVKAGRFVRASNVHIFIAGFSCKTVSNYNSDKLGARRAILDYSGQTGVTFLAVVFFLEKKKPKVCILENVKGLRVAQQHELVCKNQAMRVLLFVVAVGCA